jgi:hypothetical protein
MILTQVDFSGLVRDEDAAIRLSKAAEILAEDAQVFAARLEGSFGEILSSEALWLFSKRLRDLSADLRRPMLALFERKPARLALPEDDEATSAV